MKNALVNINRLVQKKRFITSDIVEYMEFAVVCLIAIGIPLLVRHPQLLVGVMVNFSLMITAVNLRGWSKVIPLIVLPSIAAAVGGFLFGSFTIYLVYLIPVIWLGNASLVFLMKYLYVQRKIPFVLTVPVVSVTKMLILLSVTFVFVLIGVLPELFLTVMGLMQLVTAVLGGLVAFPITLGYKRFFPMNQ